MTHPHPSPAHDWLARLAWLSFLWLAFSLPFETTAPWLQLGPLQLTNLELALSVALGLGLLQRWRRPQSGRLDEGMPPLWAVLWFIVLLAALLSALLSPEVELRLNGLKAVGRTLTGLALAWLLPHVAVTARQRTGLILALVLGGLLMAAVGLLELLRGIPLIWLDAFRTMPTTVGPFLRLSASFDHANQAAIYMEATLPLLLAWLWSNRDRRWAAAVLGLATLFYLESSFFTYSRTAFAVLLAVSLFLGVWLWQRQMPARQKMAAFWGGFAGIVLLAILINTTRSPVWNLRLRSEDDKTWYQVRFDVPAALQLAPGDAIPIPITVHNDGDLTWINAGPNPIHIGASWRRLADGAELPDRPRWHLETAVRPGQQISQIITLPAPQTPGDYELTWDMVQEYVTWFSDKTGYVAVTRVEVTGELPLPTPEDPSSPAVAGEEFVPITVTAPIPVRRVLWQIAWQQFLQRPWLGIGLDNFRLTYGLFLDAAAWDKTIHTNNWYIETLVSLGLLGGLPFLAWLGLLVVDLLRQLRRPQATIWQIGVAAGLLAYLLHGLLDYFLMFNATAILFWLLVGLWLAQREPTT